MRDSLKFRASSDNEKELEQLEQALIQIALEESVTQNNYEQNVTAAGLGSPSLAKLISNRIKAPNTIKVMVLCHGRPFAGHWQESVIRKRTEELFADRLARTGETFDFFTLDPKSDPYNPADFPHGGRQNLFQENPFSTTERWDMIWAPDCGGEWYSMMEMKGDMRRKRFTDLALTMSMSLKPGGFMMLGKLPFGAYDQSDTTVEQAVGLLSEAGFARAESAPVPDPFEPENSPPLSYILVQKQS